jgi:putative intracellular protease/amidase
MTKTIAFFQPGWADWEAGSVLPLLKLFCKADVSVVTPDGAPVTSIGGVRAAADGAFADVAADDADVFVAIGSDAWINYHDEQYFEVLRHALERGRVVGAICAATIGAARAGLFNSRSHTSNGREWLQRHVPDYAGAALYEDTARAVSNDRLVTAPGSAPNTFAASILRLIRPEAEQAIAENEALMRREWSPQAG